VSAPKQIEATSEHYVALAIMNGAKAASIFVSDRTSQARISPSPDRFNPSSERLRKQFVQHLAVPQDRREELAALLDQLAVKCEAEQWNAASGPKEDDLDEIMLADMFVERHCDRFLYTEEWHQWSEYRENVWRSERTLKVFDLIRDICREMADAHRLHGSAARIASAATIAAVEKIARARRAVSAPVESWDANPYLLNTPGGVVDLRTGEMRGAQPGDRCRQRTSVAPNFDADCPKWRAHLAWAMCGDTERVEYLHRHLGMCLTGDTSEQALDFWYGGGGNGKSVVGNVMTGILDDYAVTAPMTTFAASQIERHTTELAMLRGARLVLASETEEGRHWNEQRLKELTGGQVITARFMRQDNFTFLPTFKPIIIGNHRPHFKRVDEAIRRRLHLVSFNATVSAKEKNVRLGDKLREEWPAILAWLIEGCLMWKRQGLCPPQSVLDDTAEYLSAEDPFGDWLSEECEAREGAFTANAALFKAWSSWASRHGEEPGSLRDLRERLVQRGFVIRRTNAARGVAGIRLLSRLEGTCRVTGGDTW
jgi:putative DNA primase/helicase